MGEVERPLTEEKLRRAFARSGSEIYQREPSPEEMETMKAPVREGMELGAVGLSTGLMDPPGMYATTEEVVELAHLKAVGTHNARQVDSLIAMVETARERGVEVVSDQYPYDAAGGSIRLKDVILVEKDPERNAKLLADRDSHSTLLSDPEWNMIRQ